RVANGRRRDAELETTRQISGAGRLGRLHVRLNHRLEHTAFTIREVARSHKYKSMKDLGRQSRMLPGCPGAAIPRASSEACYRPARPVRRQSTVSPIRARPEPEPGRCWYAAQGRSAPPLGSPRPAALPRLED